MPLSWHGSNFCSSEFYRSVNLGRSSLRLAKFQMSAQTRPSSAELLWLRAVIGKSQAEFRRKVADDKRVGDGPKPNQTRAPTNITQSQTQQSRSHTVADLIAPIDSASIKALLLEKPTPVGKSKKEDLPAILAKMVPTQARQQTLVQSHPRQHQLANPSPSMTTVSSLMPDYSPLPWSLGPHTNFVRSPFFSSLPSPITYHNLVDPLDIMLAQSFNSFQGKSAPPRY